MTREVRRDPRASRVARIGRATAILAGLLLLSDAAVRSWRPEAWGLSRTLEGGAALGVLAALWPWLMYRCPACRKRLWNANYPPSPDADAGGPIHYICPRCQVEWDTGRRWMAHGS